MGRVPTDVEPRSFHWPAAFRERVEAFRRSSVGLRTGRELMDEGIYRFRGFEPVTIDLFSNWTANPVGNRSWQWNAASFNFMPWLIALHAETGDERALDHASEAIGTWHRQFVAAKSNYEFAWHDHATANRVMAVLALLCHLDEYGAKLGVDELTPGFLVAHGDRLSLDEMYSRHTNHGIDQSRALLLLATCAPWLEGAARWRRTALARLEDELAHAFAEDGGHVENSPGYHQFVSMLFADILQTFGDDLDTAFREKLRRKLVKAASFMAWLVRPDRRFPPIGDTECKLASNVYGPLSGSVEHSHVDWVCSGGGAGTRPVGWSELFPATGYFVARSDWDLAQTVGDAFHLVFRCGRLSDYHRHDDDLSLTLWWGNDWLLDGGAYSYAERDPTRRYLRSKWAHNVVVVDEGDYAWDRPGAVAPGGLSRDDDGSTPAIVKGETESYPGHFASRKVAIDINRMCFEVSDRVSPRKEEAGKQKFLSLWHVPAGKTVSVESQAVRIYDPAFMRELVIRNLGEDFDRIDVRDELPNGDEPVWSRELNKVERCRIIVFERSCETFESRLEFQLRDKRPEHRDTGTVNARARGLLRSYGLDPASWWPASGVHHARKVVARLEPAPGNQAPAEHRLEELLAMAVVRQGRRAPTLHLSNMGYPDAALIEPRLKAALGMLPAGEVYLPAPVHRVIRDWPEDERFLFIDAVHLLHAGVKPDALMFNSVINSSQGQYQEVFWRGNANALRLLALRDPVDSALNALARARPAEGWREVADAELALAREVKRLKRFAAWAVRQRFALEFRIEDLAREPEVVLGRIGSLLDADPDMAALASLRPIKPLSAAQSDAELAAIHGLPAREMLADRLSDARKTLGYTQDELENGNANQITG